jgi:hypothetical protein
MNIKTDECGDGQKESKTEGKEFHNDSRIIAAKYEIICRLGQRINKSISIQKGVGLYRHLRRLYLLTYNICHKSE